MLETNDQDLEKMKNDWYAIEGTIYNGRVEIYDQSTGREPFVYNLAIVHKDGTGITGFYIPREGSTNRPRKNFFPMATIARLETKSLVTFNGKKSNKGRKKDKIKKGKKKQKE